MEVLRGLINIEIVAVPNAACRRAGQGLGLQGEDIWGSGCSCSAAAPLAWWGHLLHAAPLPELGEMNDARGGDWDEPGLPIQGLAKVGVTGGFMQAVPIAWPRRGPHKLLPTARPRETSPCRRQLPGRRCSFQKTREQSCCFSPNPCQPLTSLGNSMRNRLPQTHPALQHYPGERGLICRGREALPSACVSGLAPVTSGMR